MTETATTPNRARIIVRDTVIVGAIYTMLLFIPYTLLQFPPSALDVVGMALIGTLGYGVAVIVPIAILRSRPKGNYAVGCVGTLFALVGGFAGGILVVFLLFQIQLPRGNWTQMAAPPEKAVEILDDDTYPTFRSHVFIRSESGTIYSYECVRYLPCEWVAAEENAMDESLQTNFCGPNAEVRYQPPFYPSGKVRDSYTGVFCGADYMVQTNYLLMQDGTVWMWERFSGMEVIILLAYTVGLGILIGVLLIPTFTFLVRPAS